MTLISKALACILTIACCIMLVLGVLKLAQNEIGSRTHTETNSEVIFPSITVCPMEFNIANVNEIALHSNFTFEDFEKLPSIKDNVIIQMIFMKSYDTE